MALSYLTQLNVKDVAYDLHDSRLSVGTNGGIVFTTVPYLSNDTSDSNKFVTIGTIPTYKYASSTSTATAGFVPSISSAISNADTKFLRADGKWAKPEAMAATIDPASDETLGGFKTGYAYTTPSYISYRDYDVKMTGSNTAFVRVQVFSNQFTTPEGYKAAGLVPRVANVNADAWQNYHLTGTGWTTYKVSGTTLILDYTSTPAVSQANS